MEHMRRIAYETVLRACGFGSLAIFCVMIGMSFEPRAAFQAGGTLTTLMACILIYKAREALTKDYRKTEMWLYVEKDFRPPEAYAQWASSTILRDTYLTFALWTVGDRDRDVGHRAAVLARRALRPGRPSARFDPVGVVTVIGEQHHPGLRRDRSLPQADCREPHQRMPLRPARQTLETSRAQHAGRGRLDMNAIVRVGPI